MNKGVNEIVNLNSLSYGLENKRAVVTGGLGLLGSAISMALAQSGASVTALDCTDENWEKQKKQVSDNSWAMNFERFDVTDLDDPNLRLAGLEKTGGNIDIWVNAAYPRTGDWAKSSQALNTASWRQNIDMHLSSYCLWSEFIAARMATHGGGAIVNVASIYGIVAPDPALYVSLEMSTPSAYSAIKGGIIAHTKHLAARYGRQGVRVNAVSPGGITNQQPTIFTDRYNAKTMLGRMATSDEIAWPIVFLCTDAANYITGANLVVDGGLTSL
jgi:NAD(P)-dependent dehydrogenase (short-subunit alcohol dehydrogenase family)